MSTQGKAKNKRMTMALTIAGIVFGSAGLYLAVGCMTMEPCETDDSGLCNPDICDHENVMCQEEALAGRTVVDNWEAKAGDVTICPYHGVPFEVLEDSERVSYEGYSFVFACHGRCIAEVEDDPYHWLGGLVQEAGGPAPDPDPADGGAIDDEDKS